MARTVRQVTANQSGIYMLMSDHSLWQLQLALPGERPQSWSQVDVPWPKLEKDPGPIVHIICPPVSHTLIAITADGSV